MNDFNKQINELERVKGNNEKKGEKKEKENLHKGKVNVL